MPGSVPFPSVRQHAPHRVDTDDFADAWEQWLTAQAGRFLLFARSRTDCEADAEDVLQESLVEAWERTPAGREPDAALVFATIRRRAIDLGRSRMRRLRREELAGATQEEADWFGCDPEDAETRALLECAVRGLPEPLREVVLLKIWGGLTFAQIAQSTGCPPNTAASRYRYGLDALRQRLKGVRA
jgi:RNA polymerase sigma-70 factor (ECF subfamily)